MNRIWQFSLRFLEIIGLREEACGDFDRRVKELKLRYFQFRDLLSANNELLEIITALEARLNDGNRCGSRYVREQALRALTAAHRMISCLDAISQGRYLAAGRAYEKIQRRISACLYVGGKDEAKDVWVVPLSGLTRSSAWLAGNKMANLGEIANAARLAVPSAFVVTTLAHERFLEAAHAADGGLFLKAPEQGEGLEDFAARARKSVLDTPVPPEVAKSILEACRSLAKKGSSPPAVSVRSSAIDEDAALSFAGQYATFLNVTEGNILDAYKQTLASVYEPAAVEYRLHMGLEETEAAIAVGVVEMVSARCSGVAFSRDPVQSSSQKVVIHAAWGLGPSLVDGRVAPDVYLVDREGGAPRVEAHPSVKSFLTVNKPGGGTGEEPVPLELQRKPCLTEKEAADLAAMVLRLEAHFGAPQDVEWAMDQEGNLLILQSRPLSFAEAAAEGAEPPLPEAEILFAGGATAVPGAGCGPVYIALNPDDGLDDFPDGGVLVASHSSPKFVRVMKKASAIVTDVGSTIGHMASLAREFGVPTILGVSGATSRLKSQEVVTVDATNRRIFGGMVEQILSAQPPRKAGLEGARASSLLQEVSKYIVPLSLTDPRSPGFTPINCTTLHDLGRYVHERSFQEMFGIGGIVGNAQSRAPYLDVFLPLDLYIIDLGGGLDIPAGKRKVKPENIRSPLFAALVRGMLHKGIPRFGPRALDAKGLFHVMMRHGLSGAETEATFRDPCYAIISDKYVNLASRVGYHFSALDAYSGEFIDQNYISFRFKGGAADAIRRSRRVRAIAEILAKSGFDAEVSGDLVTAHLRKREPAAILAGLEMLGKLLQFMRQMDAAMSQEAMVGKIAENFLNGKYNLQGES